MKTTITLEVSFDEYLIIKRVFSIPPEEINKRLTAILPRTKLVEELNISSRTANALRKANFKTEDDLKNFIEEDGYNQFRKVMLRIRNIGPTALAEIERALNK